MLWRILMLVCWYACVHVCNSPRGRYILLKGPARRGDRSGGGTRDGACVRRQCRSNSDDTGPMDEGLSGGQRAELLVQFVPRTRRRRVPLPPRLWPGHRSSETRLLSSLRESRVYSPMEMSLTTPRRNSLPPTSSTSRTLFLGHVPDAGSNTVSLVQSPLSQSRHLLTRPIICSIAPIFRALYSASASQCWRRCL